MRRLLSLNENGKLKHFFQDIWQLADKTEQALLMLIALYQLKNRVQKTDYDLSDISIIFSRKTSCRQAEGLRTTEGKVNES